MDTDNAAFLNQCPGCFEEKSGAGLCVPCGLVDRNRPTVALPYGARLLNGRYMIGRVLGKQGGTGITYLAFDSSLKRKVAIKEFMPYFEAFRENAGLFVRPNIFEDANFSLRRSKFITEARDAARFRHHSIIHIFDVFEENNTAYLVMEYHYGRTLREYLTDHGAIKQSHSLDIMLQILDGLKEIHDQGYIHLDIKPDNIYMANDEKPILLDFGEARQYHGVSHISPQGTPRYAPIEQADEKSPYKKGPWTDIYACSAVLYEMTTNTKVPPSINRIYNKDSLINPRELNPWLTAGFINAVLQALAVLPRQRPQNVEKFRLLLEGGNTWKVTDIIIAWKFWFLLRVVHNTVVRRTAGMLGMLCIIIGGGGVSLIHI